MKLLLLFFNNTPREKLSKEIIFSKSIHIINGSSVKWQPTSVFLPGKFHRQRSLVGNSPWGRKESDMTEQLHSLVTQNWVVLCFGRPINSLSFFKEKQKFLQRSDQAG